MNREVNMEADYGPRVRRVYRMNRPQEQGLYTLLRPLVPATASPRRLEMLLGLGLAVDPWPADLAEPSPMPGEDPAAYALRASAAKAKACAAALPAEFHDAVILAADTIVTIDNDILGKPRDAEHAVEMLVRLSGREHQVVTACSFRAPDFQEDFAVTSRVVFIPLDRQTAQAYAAGGEPMDKAGAYAVQGTGACLVAEVHGSWTGVVGLPLSEVVGVLVRRGVIGLRGKE